MLVEIVKTESGEAKGWTLKGENPEEIKKLGHIRDMQFFGFDGTAIVYNGRTDSDDPKGDPGTLHWFKKKFTSRK